MVWGTWGLRTTSALSLHSRNNTLPDILAARMPDTAKYSWGRPLGLLLPLCPRASSSREVLAQWSFYHSTCVRIKAQGAPGMRREVGGGALR